MSVLHLLRRRQYIPTTTISDLLTTPPRRSMGGGPRTFPGGLSKWQYKRMHEKLARRKQAGLLRQEKQLYLSRLRSDIRSSRLHPELQPPSSSDAGPTCHTVGPMSSRSHIKALADRFMKPGAEDLWNEADGPIRSPSKSRTDGLRRIERNWSGQRGMQITPRNEALTGGRRRIERNWNGRDDNMGEPPLALYGQKRGYSVGPNGAFRSPAPGWMPWHLNVVDQKRMHSGFATGRGRVKQRVGWSDTDESEEEEEELTIENIKRDLRFGRLGAVSDAEDVDDGEELGGRAGGAKKKMLSSAALRNVDAKKERRKVNNSFKEEEEDKRGFAGGIRELGEDVMDRELINRKGRRYMLNEDRLLTNKRFVILYELCRCWKSGNIRGQKNLNLRKVGLRKVELKS